jgi:phage-related protein
MRDLNSTFISEKNKQENAPIHLYVIHDYDGSNTLYLTSQKEDKTFDGQVYTSYAISHDSVGENKGGKADQVTLKIGNVARLFQAYFEAYDFRGLKVTIKTIFSDTIATAAAVMSDVFYIDSYDADQQNAIIHLTSKWDVLEYKLPARKYARNYCQWKFKSTECGYAGGETECNKSLTRCKVLDNQLRFGGFPSIPSKRIFIR